MQPCPLCKTPASTFSDQFYECLHCGAIFRDPASHLSPEKEKDRYLKHNNNVNDPGYQQFVSPLTETILNKFTSSHSGLDFGAGPDSAASKLLTDQNFNIVKYDPFFHNYPELLKTTYDYIVCCEVMEHFNDPHKEFLLLKNLLKPNGVLYCMTSIYIDKIDFKTWYYKNDKTHLFFYREKTLNWIKESYGFAELIIENNLIILENK